MAIQSQTAHSTALTLSDGSPLNISVPGEDKRMPFSGGTFADYYFAGFLRNTKISKPDKDIKILGISSVTFNEVSYKASDGTLGDVNALTETLDTTTHPDRAILKLYNGRGFNVYLRSATLDGKMIYQYSGEAGELIHDSLKRDDDIRRNGETVFEIGNEYIVDATQCASIADFWYKFLGKKKHLYALPIPGSAPWYNVGDWYNLQVGEADTNEYIDTVVECYAVDVEKSAGGIGSTTLLLRDVEDNWSKTTLYATRLATGGSPKRRVNRSNIVTVASSEYDGAYDYKCDGTDDDVQIQAAIDYVSNTFGNGEILLTNGTFKITSMISVKANITIKGSGSQSTIIERDGDIYGISVLGSAGNLVSSFNVYNIGVIEKTGNTTTKPLYRISYAGDFLINNCSASGSNGSGFQIAYSENSTISTCVATNCANATTLTGLHGIIVAASTSVNVLDCVASLNGGIAGNGTGIFVTSSNYCSVSESVASNNLSAGIFIGDSGYCRVVNCVAEGNTLSGILVGLTDGASGCSNSTVSNNQSTQNTENGIYIYNSSSTTVTANACFSNAVNGIEINADSDNNVISSNTVMSNSAYGIIINNANCDTNIVSSNRANSNTSGNYADAGTGTTATGNDFT